MNFNLMKHFLVSLFFIIGYHSFSQITCTVSPSDTTVCYRDSIAFTAFPEGQGPFTYQWLKNGVIIADAADSILPIPRVDYPDTAVYICIVSNGTDTDTSNTARLRMHPKMKIDTLYRYNSLDCPDTCTAQFKVLVSGGAPPYTYDWVGVNPQYIQDTIAFGLCPGSHPLILTDTNHCSLDTAYYVDVLKLPKFSIASDPQETVYLTKPFLTVTFPEANQAGLESWYWHFGNNKDSVPNLNPVTYIIPDTTKPGKFIVRLHYTDNNTCDSIISYEITVKKTELNIFNVFTPDDNQYNQTFVIKLKDTDDAGLDFSDVYYSNELQIHDRWGKKVFSKTNYKSGEWDGEKISDGVYYYILKCQGYYREDVYKGSITILRAH